MLLKKALLDILVKLADQFDMAENESAATVVDNMIENLSDQSSDFYPEIEIEVDPDEANEIRSVLEKALQSMNGLND